MYNQISDNSSQQNINPEQLLGRFDEVISKICDICHENNIDGMLIKLKSLMIYNGHFRSLVDNVVKNSHYQYNNHNYENLEQLLSKLLSEFTPEEHLVLIANMNSYGIGDTDKTTDLLKYFMRKIIKQRILND